MKELSPPDLNQSDITNALLPELNLLDNTKALE